MWRRIIRRHWWKGTVWQVTTQGYVWIMVCSSTRVGAKALQPEPADVALENQTSPGWLEGGEGHGDGRGEGRKCSEQGEGEATAGCEPQIP